VSFSACSTSWPSECPPAHCRWRCALEVIDELICQPGQVSRGDIDQLLELRWKLGQRDDAEGALRIFCDLRLRMEQRHYLAFFRIRRWLENHLVASIRICPVAEPQFVPVKLDHYCVEAIRRASLCRMLRSGAALLAPRLNFVFRAVLDSERDGLGPVEYAEYETALALTE